MSNRHLARSLVMQCLYQWDFRGKPSAAIPAITKQVVAEFGLGLDEGNKDFVRDTVVKIVDKLPAIDEKIMLYAPKWPLEQMSAVDRNILRVGVFEMYFNDAIPAKVAINEAIEIAKSFGGQSSGKFVNGILGAMYNQLVKDGKVKEGKKN